MSTTISRLTSALRDMSLRYLLRGQTKLPPDDPTLSGLASMISRHRTPPSRQVEDLLIAYSRLPWLRSVVGKISYATSSTQWKLFVYVPGGTNSGVDSHGMPRGSVKNRAIQKAQAGTRQKIIAAKQAEGTIVEIGNHILLNLLDQFNPTITGIAGRKLTQIHIDLVGEAFWLKQRDPAGTVIGLWPIPPPWVSQTQTPAKPYYEIEFSSFRATIPADDMVWFRDIDPARPYWRGKGTTEALGDELETDEFAAKHCKTEFYNRGVPELLITADGMGDDETRRLETDWRQRNQSFWKSLQVYFLNRKVDVKQLGQSFRSLQLIQLREFERNMVIQVFGVPPEILGIVDKSNRATITAADFLFSKWVLLPRIEMQREVIQEMLVKDFDDRLILDYESPVEEDWEQRMQASKAAPWAQSVDEWRAMQGLEPLPDGQGKVFMVPQNLLPVRYPAGGLPAQEPQQPGPPQPPAGSTELGRSKLRLAYDKDAIEEVENLLRSASEGG